jgi:hypothetical protein
MVRTDVITPPNKSDRRHDRCHVAHLHNAQQNLSSNDAVDHQQKTCDKPDDPCPNAYAPRAFFYPQMMDLRVVRNDYKRCSDPADDFHACLFIFGTAEISK